MTKRGSAIAIALLSLVACGGDPAGPELPLQRQLTAAEASIAQASNAFGFDLIGRLAAVPTAGNIFFSPLSVSMNLGLVANGAGGRTLAEMTRVLRVGSMDQAATNAAVSSLTSLLLAADTGLEIHLANSVWVDERAQLDDTFVGVAQDDFEATVAGVDFSSSGAAGRVNQWVADATEGYIDAIVDSFDPAAVLAVLNAVYFHAPWTTPFDERLTRSGPFHLNDGRTREASFMERTGTFARGSFGHADVLEIPYGGGAFAMTIVLPRGASLSELVADLTTERWEAWVGGLTDARVSLSLPRFRLAWGGDLVEQLRGLGMADAFERDAADFTRALPGRRAWIGEVRHKAVIEVDEEGTVAAATTGTVLFDSDHAPFEVDRPFLFAIRERQSGAILFLGVVNDPTATE